MGLNLTIVAGPARGASLKLGDRPLLLGRAEAGAGALGGDPELSREHARISEFEADRILLEDLGSTNGTFVNGGQVAGPTVLSDGDVIWVGTSTLLVRAPEQPLPEVPPVEPPTPSPQGRFLSRLADLAEHRPKRLLIGLVIFFLFAVAFGGPVTQQLRDERGFFDPNAEASLALEEIANASGAYPGPGVVVMIDRDREVTTDRRAEREVRTLQRDLAADEDVALTLSYFDFNDHFFLSRDGTSTFVVAILKNIELAEREEAAERLREEYGELPGVSFGGPLVATLELREQVERDLIRAELIALPLLLVVSFFVFRSLIAALLPLFVGIVAIPTSFLALRLIDTVGTVNIFALNIVTALSLGLAIDYSLFMVSRYREELAKVGAGRTPSGLYGATGAPPEGASGLQYAGSQAEALRRTVFTAGRTIMFSALTVAVALLALVVFPNPFLYSMGIGGAVAAMTAVLVALVMLPALLSILGPRVNGLAPRWMQRAAYRTASEERAGPWYRLSQAVMRRPLPIALISAALMISVGLSVTRIDFAGVNARVLPQSLEAKEVSDRLATDFPADPSAQIQIAVEADPDQRAEVGEFASRIERHPGIAAVFPPRQLNPQFWQIDVQPWLDGQDDRTLELAEEIRAEPAPFPFKLTGDSADFLDERSGLGSRLPIALALLTVTTFTILFVMTGSVVIPLKSILMNLLTVSFTLGVLVLVFQDGRFQDLLGYVGIGKVDMAQPIVICAVVFGLSTDYAVFLLGRIAEARVHGASDDEAVAIGIERTGRVVTQAALLFCLAIAAFTTSEVIYIKQVGVAVATGVIIDATIVRGLLVPSLMKMLGARNWWAPPPLRRLHRRIGFSEA